MSGYKLIVACLNDAETVPQTLELALRLGQLAPGHVVGLHVRTDPASAVPLVGEGMSGAMVEEMLGAAERQGQERADRIRTAFEQTCRRTGVITTVQPGSGNEVTAEWREEVGREEEVLAEVGRLADLVVMARPSEADVSSMMTLNAALLETGHPLVLAPPRLPATLARRIAIFWNGSIEAARAITGAQPLLSQADHLDVLAAREENVAIPAGLAHYLAWHGLTAEAHCIASDKPLIGHTLLSKAGAIGADFIVMGAYTHSRLRQLIMGGVTRHLLQSSELPVLLCH